MDNGSYVQNCNQWVFVRHANYFAASYRNISYSCFIRRKFVAHTYIWTTAKNLFIYTIYTILSILILESTFFYENMVFFLRKQKNAAFVERKQK